jgi:hypothetical protein
MKHHTSDRTHEFEATKGLGIAREGGRAKISVVHVHPSSLSRFDANPPSPTAGGAPAGKSVRRAEINPGSRSRNLDSIASESAGVAHARASAKGTDHIHSLGQAILNEAYSHADRQTRRAFGCKE